MSGIKHFGLLTVAVVGADNKDASGQVMTHDHLDSAYATLGLNHDASSSAVKRRYKALVRKWHPDRFTSDPQSVAEATLMLQAVNHAYSTILDHRSAALMPEPYSDSSHQSQASRSFGDRLTPTQIDEIVAAIRHSESLLAVVFDEGVAGWRSRAASLSLALAYAATAWKYGESVTVLYRYLLPLLCIWFPDELGAYVGGRVTKPSPPRFVWVLGWVVLLMPVVGFGIIWWRTR